MEKKDKEAKMMPRFLNMYIEKIVVTSSEIVKFGIVNGLEEKCSVFSSDLMSSR